MEVNFCHLYSGIVAKSNKQLWKGIKKPFWSKVYKYNMLLCLQKWIHSQFFVFSNILNSVLESDIFYAIYVSGLTFIYFFFIVYIFIHYFHSIVTHYIWDLYISAYNIDANIDLCMIIHYVVNGFFCKWEWERTKHIEWIKCI